MLRCMSLLWELTFSTFNSIEDLFAGVLTLSIFLPSGSQGYGFYHSLEGIGSLEVGSRGLHGSASPRILGIRYIVYKSSYPP